MTRETDYLIQQMFKRENLGEMPLFELEEFSKKFPYSSIIRLLHTLKLKKTNESVYQEAVYKAAMYFDNTYWLDYQLSDENEGKSIEGLDFESEIELKEKTLNESANNISAITLIQEQIGRQELIRQENVASNSDELIAFEPYHTVDYFASQGIKLSLMEGKDELSQKVKSFTAWLKTMKKLQPLPENLQERKTDLLYQNYDKNQNPTEPQDLVITEAMAEVYLKQGLYLKAIEIYNKLSLQNPSNSHIFAARISAIKENKL